MTRLRFCLTERACGIGYLTSKMLHRHKLLNSENHGLGDVGDLKAGVRADFEDALVQALEDCLRDGKTKAFLEFIERWRAEFLPQIRELCHAQDSWAWYYIYLLTCSLRRMEPRWEHAANKLKDQYNLAPNLIPEGTEFLYR
jgi:hypothetical protein